MNTSNDLETILSLNTSLTTTIVQTATAYIRTQQEEAQLRTLNVVNFYVYDLIGFVLFTCGVFFNLISFIYFQLSRSFRGTSMRHYFSVLSITDSIRLSEWLLTILIDKELISLSNGLCRAFLFVTITSGHISIWLLVFLSIERYFILQFPFRGNILL
jgi:hypothetical protein